MEEGKWSDTETGTPQGSVISPLPANIYLHYASDLWVDVWRRKHARGDVIVVRYTDDIVSALRSRSDLPPISQPLITRVFRFWFGSEINSQPPSRLCKCGKRSELSTFA